MPRPLIFVIEASIAPMKHELNGASPDEISPFFKESMNVLIEQWGFDKALKFNDQDKVLALEVINKHPTILGRECFGSDFFYPFPEYLPARLFDGRKQGDVLKLLFDGSKILSLKCTGRRKSYFDPSFESLKTKLVGD